jgi:hypothetical protein
MFPWQSGRRRFPKVKAVSATIFLAACSLALLIFLFTGRDHVLLAASPTSSPPLSSTGLQQQTFNSQPDLEIVPQPLSPARSVISYDWGDVDGDGDLDLAVGTSNRGNQVYRNQNGDFTELVWTDGMSGNNSTAIAWGDIDGDGDLDLAIGLAGAPNRLYLNQGGSLQTTPAWNDQLNDPTSDLVWADMNGDGYLDLIVANRGTANKIFLNTGDGLLATTAAWEDPGQYETTTSVDTADMDLDGDLDLAFGNYVNDRPFDPTSPIPPGNYYTHVFRNQGSANGQLQLAADWSGGTAVNDVAWGDVNGDRYPDLALVDYSKSNELDGIYLNSRGSLSASNDWSPRSGAESFDPPRRGYSVAWGDMDNDGDLDLAMGFSTDARERIYQNNNGRLAEIPAWESPSFERGYHIGWADIDRDNDLDLTVIYAGRVHVYTNHINHLSTQSAHLETGNQPTTLSWGDMDNDGDLDLAVGSDQGTTVYRRDGANLTPITLSNTRDRTAEVAWGDVNGDGWLDLAVGRYLSTNLIYLNQKGTIDDTTPVIDLGEADLTRALAWGDLNGDGWPDLAVGNQNSANRIYINQQGTLSSTQFITIGAESNSGSLAWGDVDADGDLDLAVGNIDQENQLYFNEQGALSDTRVQTLGTSESSYSLAWGDINGDGGLDLVVGNSFQVNQLYLNDAGRLAEEPAWTSGDLDDTRGIALGDVDGDGDLDLAAANASGDDGAAAQANRLYLNEGGRLQTIIDNPWTSLAENPSLAVAWGDTDGDSDLDLVAASLSGLDIYTNKRLQAHPFRASLSILLSPFASPRQLPDGSQSNLLSPIHSYGATGSREDGRITFTYTLVLSSEQPIAAVQGFYSLDGGGHWLAAVPTTDTQTTNLSTAWLQNQHTYTWDVFRSGMIGQSDNVVFRLEVYETLPGADALPPGTMAYTVRKGGVYQQPFVSVTSRPFSVRGNQIQVMHENGTEMEAAAGAMVYRIPPASLNGRALADQSRIPYVTDGQGYLQGRAQLEASDQLVALWPVPEATQQITFTEKSHFYYISASPTISGLQTTAVGELNGVLPLVVNDQKPLILYDLIISLEWDASDDEIFLLELEESIRRASELLFDVTNGQMALGRVDVFQAKSYWNAADVVIYADNSLRPSAAIGGVVNTSMPDTVISPTKKINAYVPGQIKMGPSWDPFRLSSSDFGEDWWQALAHELAHYLLFLPDNYLGFKEGDILGRVNCPLSFMTTTRDPGYTEFLTGAEWTGNCLNTLAERTTGRYDWQTVRQFYPMLNAPDGRFEGPRALPLNVTRIVRWIPQDEVETLPSRIFEIRDAADERLRLPQAEVYLIRTQDNDDPTDDLLVYLGKPTGGGDRIKVRGGFTHDRLCLFDQSGSQPLANCINDLSADDVAFNVRPVSGPTWQPEINARPETTRTIHISVTQELAPGEQLNVQVYPGHYRSVTSLSPVAVMSRTGNIHTQNIVLPLPAYDVSVRVWVDDDSQREAVRRFFVRIPWGPNDMPLGGPNDMPLGGPNDMPLGGPNDMPLGGPNDMPLGGPNDMPLGGPNDMPLGGPNDMPLGGPNDMPLGGPNDMPLGGADNRTFTAPILSADAQVVAYNRNGFFEPNGVEALQLLNAIPFRESHPWLVPVGPAYEVTLDDGVDDERIIAITYLQRDVPEGYEHTVNIYFLPDGETTWQRLPTRREVENLVVADLTDQNGTYAVMATIALPTLEPGWNLLAYPLPVSRSVTATLSAISGSYSLVHAASPADLMQSAVMTRPEQTLTALSNINVRRGPGSNQSRISYLLRGETAEIHWRDPETGWWLITCPPRTRARTTCWVTDIPVYVQVSESTPESVAPTPGTLVGQSPVAFFHFGHIYWVFITTTEPVTLYLAPPVLQPDGSIR